MTRQDVMVLGQDKPRATTIDKCNLHVYVRLLFICDALNAGSLQGSHPSVEEGVVSRKVCFGYYQSRYRYGQKQINNCCKQSIYIKVRNCGSFYVYKLKPTPYNSRYCTQY